MDFYPSFSPSGSGLGLLFSLWHMFLQNRKGSQPAMPRASCLVSPGLVEYPGSWVCVEGHEEFHHQFPGFSGGVSEASLIASPCLFKVWLAIVLLPTTSLSLFRGEFSFLGKFGCCGSAFLLLPP